MVNNVKKFDLQLSTVNIVPRGKSPLTNEFNIQNSNQFMLLMDYQIHRKQAFIDADDNDTYFKLTLQHKLSPVS